MCCEKGLMQLILNSRIYCECLNEISEETSFLMIPYCTMFGQNLNRRIITKASGGEITIFSIFVNKVLLNFTFFYRCCCEHLDPLYPYNVNPVKTTCKRQRRGREDGRAGGGGAPGRGAGRVPAAAAGRWEGGRRRLTQELGGEERRRFLNQFLQSQVGRINAETING